MKQFTFVRHGKSSWKNLELLDHDRPLNKRGKHDSKRMSKWYALNFDKPDLIISSTAKRAASTMKHFSEIFSMKKNDIVITNELYHVSEDRILSVLYGIDDVIDNVMLFGHNLGCTDLANIFSNDYIPNIATCGIFSVIFDTNKWNEISIAPSTFVGYYAPKAIFPETSPLEMH